MPDPFTSQFDPPLSGTTARPGIHALGTEGNGRGGVCPATTVQCARCGEEWPGGDPALRVPCPNCQAPPGRRCRRPSAHECVVHAARDRLAMDMGLLRPCPALTWNDRHSKPLPFSRQTSTRPTSLLACTEAAPAQGVLL